MQPVDDKYVAAGVITLLIGGIVSLITAIVRHKRSRKRLQRPGRMS
jgi:hypothetical protein